MLLHTQGPLAQWLEQATHNRLVAGSSPARATKSLFTYQEELRVQGVLDGGLYFMTNAISRKKCGGWFRMRAGVLVRGTPLQCIYPSVLIQKYGSDSNLLIVFYVQIMPDDLVMQLHRF